jgi:antitoxin HicB
VTESRKYPKQVFWSDEDGGFIAIAPDLPGCSAVGDSEAGALAELDDAIEAWISATTASGNSIPSPSPLATRPQHSGKLLLRMPRSLHQVLATTADREGVSLNQYIVFVLTRHSSSVIVSTSSAQFTRVQDPYSLASALHNFAPAHTITGAVGATYYSPVAPNTAFEYMVGYYEPKMSMAISSIRDLLSNGE